jgi:3-phosphoshikimate 1-carboxyvinyltransferase
MALPDLIEIVPLDKPVRAEITVPGSKSITNRALILAALADGETVLQGALWSEDTQIMVECLQKLSFMVNVEPDPNETCNRTITVYGNGGAVPPGGTEAQPMELFVGNAGTAARFLAPFLCLGSGVYRLHGVPRMHERPQAALFQALRELGYRVESENGNDKLPVKIWGGRADLPVSPDAQQPVPTTSCKVSIEESSQFASALLLSAKHGNWEIEVVGENAEESPYVVMTTKLIEVFPRSGEFPIEPDASSGSYFVGAGWMLGVCELIDGLKKDLPPTKIKLSGVGVNLWPNTRWQIDEAFIQLTKIDFPSGHNPIAVSEFEKFVVMPLRISRNTDLGDSIMTQITLTPLLKTGSIPVVFTDLGRLRVQECERVIALREQLTKCGAKVIEEGNTLTVYPSKPEELHGAEIETYNDHRMAMCFAILGLKVPGIKIKNPACVKKTFPNFFQKLAAEPPHGLGAEIWEIKDGRRARRLSGDNLFAD